MTNKFFSFLDSISCITKMAAQKVPEQSNAISGNIIEKILKLKYHYSMQCIGTNNIHFI